MKKILICSVILISIFLIYLGNNDKKVYYLALGDSIAKGITPYGNVESSYTDYIRDYLNEKKIIEEYRNEFISNNYRVTDIINDIKENKKIVIDKKNKRLKNLLIKADLLTLSIGSDELFSKIALNSNMDYDDIFNYIDQLFVDLDELLKLIREYCKEDIIITGYYNPYSTNNYDIEEIFDYLDIKFNQLSKKYEVNYVPINNALKDKKYFTNPKSIYPSKEGYKKIADEIIKVLNNTTLK